MSCVTDGHPLPDLQISEIVKLTITPVGLEFYCLFGVSYFFSVCGVCACVSVCVCMHNSSVHSIHT